MKGTASRALFRLCARTFGPLLVMVGLALLLSARAACAQATHGLISGTVTDPQGGAIPGAIVTVKNQLTTVSETTQTNNSGNFVFPALLPGTYTVSVEKTGFEKLEQTDITIFPADRRDLGSLQVRLGSTKSMIAVTGTANPVETTSSDQSAVITTSQMAALPSIGRDYMALARVLPGSSQLGEGSASLGLTTATPVFEGVSNPMGVNVSTNGVISSISNYSFDQIGTVMDNIADVKVLTANYEAQYGKVMGAVINVTTKSGTTNFHGGAYYYLRNEDLNANDFFSNRLSEPRARYRYNTVGATLGGPIYGPGPFERLRNKLFFFFSYDNEPNSAPAGPREYLMPTATERTGDFSQSYIPGSTTQLYTVLNPATGQQFPGNIVPPTLLNPLMAKVLTTLPLPNFTDSAVSENNYNYVINDSNSMPLNDESIRVDYAPGDKWRIFGRFARISNDIIGRTGGYSIFAGWMNGSQSNISLNDRYELNVTTTINPHMVNQIAIGHNSQPGTSGLPQSTLSEFQMTALGINFPQPYPGNNPLNLLPAMNFNTPNAPSWGYNGNVPNVGYVYNLDPAHSGV